MPETRLWRNESFLRFFIGAGLSVVGDWFNTVAIAVLTYRLTGRVALVAVTLAVSVLPRLVLAPVGGALADRFERRGLLIALDSARAVVALLPLLAHDGGSVWVIYLAVLLLQAGTCIYNPAQGAYVSHLVPDDLLETANAAYATMRDVGMFAGPALAAVALGIFGPAIAFWSNALSFVIAAMLLRTLPRALPGAARAANLPALLAGYLAIARRYPRITALYLCYLARTVPIFFLQAIMVVYARELGQPTTFIGLLYATAGLGGALGGLAMGRYLRHLPYGATAAIFVVNVPLLGALALVHQAALALIVIACASAAGTAGDVIFTVNVQRHVASEERGRAFGMLFWCIAIGQLLGAGLGITVSALTAVPALLWISMAVLPIVAVGVLLSVRAAQRPGMAPAAAVAEGA